jgi:hypothetical protein
MFKRKHKRRKQSFRVERIDLDTFAVETILASSSDDDKDEQSSACSDCTPREPPPLDFENEKTPIKHIQFATDPDGNILRFEHENKSSMSKDELRRLWYSPSEIRWFRHCFQQSFSSILSPPPRIDENAARQWSCQRVPPKLHSIPQRNPQAFVEI